MTADAVPECLPCGACCFSQLEQYVAVTGDDYARLADLAERFVVFDGHRAYMRMAAGHCAALAVDRASGRFVCQVYEQRPQTCRDLLRGSGACRAEREAKAERPLALLRQAQGKASAES